MTIPEISFSYFNTDLKKFETITTKAIPLMIIAAAKKKNPVVIIPNLSNDKYLWFVPGIAILVITVWLFTNKNGKKTDTKPFPVKEELQTIIKEPEQVRPDYALLLTALNEAEDNQIFFTNAKTLLISALQYHFSPKQNDEIILLNVLNTKDEVLAKEAKQIINTCNKGLYSPVEDEATRMNVIENLSALINELDKA